MRNFIIMAKAKQAKQAPTTPEVVAVEGTIEETSYTPPELTKFEKQLGITAESFTGEYSPSADLKVRFASIMELMYNYHMSCESKNDARYKDIMNHILTSCELASTFVR